MGMPARLRSPSPVLHGDETGMTMRQSKDGIDLLCTASQDGDDDFILWGCVGDDNGLHVCPHSPKL